MRRIVLAVSTGFTNESRQPSMWVRRLLGEKQGSSHDTECSTGAAVLSFS
jgi:hypothetical protein